MIITGVERQEYRIKNLHLTPLKITFPFSARSKVVRKAWEDEKVRNFLFGLLIRWIDSFNTVAQNVHIVILMQT